MSDTLGPVALKLTKIRIPAVEIHVIKKSDDNWVVMNAEASEHVVIRQIMNMHDDVCTLWQDGIGLLFFKTGDFVYAATILSVP
jgi:hypothetical protein